MLSAGLRFRIRKQEGTEGEYRMTDRKKVRGLWPQLSPGFFGQPWKKRICEMPIVCDNVGTARSNSPSLLRIKWTSSLVFLAWRSLAGHFGSVCINWGVAFWIILRLELGQKMKALDTQLAEFELG